MCLDGTRQRMQMAMLSLLKRDVITQLLEQEIEDFIAKHAKEVDLGNQIHMKASIYAMISILDSASIAKIDSFYLKPQEFLQQKDVLEFFDNLDNKIKEGLKIRINEIEQEFDKIFNHEPGSLPTTGSIKDFNIFLNTNGFQDVEIINEEFYSLYLDNEFNLRDSADQALKEDLKKTLRERLLESITKKYPTLDKEKLERIFKKDLAQSEEDGIQDQYLSTNIDLFYDDERSSKKLDSSKIGNLVAFFKDNSSRGSSSQTQEPDIGNINKGLIILRNIGQNFKNSNSFYFLEFFKQFQESTGLTFEDYFLEAPPQNQSQDQSQSQTRQIKGIFKDHEGIIKDIITRRNILSATLLQKQIGFEFVDSEEEKRYKQELFEVCNAIFLGKEDEESKGKILAFKEILNSNSYLASQTYNFFIRVERIFFNKLIQNDDDKVLGQLIDLLPSAQKNELKSHRPDYVNNFLQIAVLKGVVKVIDVLTNPNIAGIDINSLNYYQETALMIASQYGHLEVVKELIKGGANVNLATNAGQSVLMLALINGKLEIAKKLIEAVENVNHEDVYGITALMIASRSGYSEVVKELIKKNAEINTKDKSGYTALIVASQYGHFEVVKELIKKLIEKGLGVDSKNEKGYTALIVASQHGHLEVVKELIKNGAKVDLKNNNGQTALMHASQNRSFEVVNELLKNGADLTGITEDFMNSIQSQVIKDNIKKYQDFYSKKDNEEILYQIQVSLSEYLSDSKALTDFSTINFPDDRGQVQSIELNFNAISNIYNFQNHLLMIALQNDNLNVVKKLIENGVDINLKDGYGNTALILASQRGHLEVVKELIKNGADINLQSYIGYSALIYASSFNHLEIVKELIKNGADVDLFDSGEETALMHASQNGHPEVVNELLKNGADLTGITEDFMHSIQSQEIKDNIKKYQDFYSKKNSQETSSQIQIIIDDYLNGSKALTDFSTINFPDDRGQAQSIELNFNAISNIYELDTERMVSPSIKELIKAVKELRMGSVIGLTSARLVGQGDRVINQR
ncbi:MAG: hypothetical protein RL769_409 [Pseudomonadota bacterium]